MAVGVSTAVANALADQHDNEWIQLHTGDPGANGTANVASNSTRQQISLAPASGGIANSDAVVEWTNVPATEVYTHASLWTASTAGTFRRSGTVASGSVNATNVFRFPVGQLGIDESPGIATT